LLVRVRPLTEASQTRSIRARTSRATWNSLHGFEDQIAYDEDREDGVADQIFASKADAFEAGWYLGHTYGPPPIDLAALAGKPNSWGPHALYRKDSSARRVYFLELVAWTIVKAEDPQIPAKSTKHSQRNSS
jgi:hypothetical protein